MGAEGSMLAADAQNINFPPSIMRDCDHVACLPLVKYLYAYW
jgi:hypothetical protein